SMRRFSCRDFIRAAASGRRGAPSGNSTAMLVRKSGCSFRRHTPVRSGLPSAVLGAGAETFGLPSAVRGVPGSGTWIHCACAAWDAPSRPIASSTHTAEADEELTSISGLYGCRHAAARLRKQSTNLRERVGEGDLLTT